VGGRWGPRGEWGGGGSNTVQSTVHTTPQYVYTVHYSIGGKAEGGLTGRQLPPLSSVLYGIISRRRSVLAAQLHLREKSGA
jgi:hypothetical protein